MSAAKASGVTRNEGEWSKDKIVTQEILPRLVANAASVVQQTSTVTIERRGSKVQKWPKEW